MDKGSAEEDSLVPMHCQPQAREVEPLYAGGVTHLILECGV